MLRRTDFLHAVRGFLMGGADIIPGVSGGTVALILAIYERFVTAVSRFDLALLEHLRRREWGRAAGHVDLRFLLALAGGIALGVGGLATLMRYLLDHHLQQTYSAFFGLILASSFLVARMINRWGPVCVFGLAGGIVFAYWLVGRLPAEPPPGNLYVFFCGVVAICAMILPGISGAFILLILGKYRDMTGLLSGFLHGEITPESTLTLAVFLAGCLIGLLSFSKLLNRLLDRYEPQTMAVLCGFMVGSLRRIWPFKVDLTPEVEKVDHKQFRNVLPEEWTGDEWLSIALMIAACLFVLALDWLTGGHAQEPLPHHGQLKKVEGQGSRAESQKETRVED